MKPLIVICLLIPAVFLCGCSSAPIEVSKLPGEIRYATEDAVAVRLDAATTRRQENMIGAFGDKHAVVTGTIWARVFVGFEPSSPTLTIEQSELREHVGVLGFSTRYTYTANATLHFRGHDFPISANGSRAASLMAGSAMRQSVELTVVDAAHQAKAIILANTQTIGEIPQNASASARVASAR